MTTPRWTDDDLLLMHEVGREYERARLTELAEEIALLDLMPPPASAEQRYAERMAVFAACAAEVTQRQAGVAP